MLAAPLSFVDQTLGPFRRLLAMENLHSGNLRQRSQGFG